MKLLKLVYIAHGWNLGLSGRPLIRESAEAWRYGPVIPELYHGIKRFREKDVPLDQIKVESEPNFTSEEEDIMDQTMAMYSLRPAFQLSRMTHAPGTPWDVVYNELGESAEIPNDLIEDHYDRLYRKRTKSDAAD